MRFGILGPLELSEAGRAVNVAGAKQRALLVMLLLNANRVVSSGDLIDAVWEEEPPDSATKALQVHVSQLRKLLGKHHVETRAPGYLLRVEQDALDLDQFTRLYEEGRLDESLSLWRGSPLAEFAYHRFAQAEIGRLQELHLRCLEDRIERDLAAGRHDELVGELEGLVSEHPLREQLRCQSMLALYRAGRQAEALSSYQRARTALVDELGIEPSRALRELEKAILEQDPALDLVLATGEELEATDGSRGVFVGREAELAELHHGLDEALAGRGVLFLLVGEPGIGKTRLAEEVVRRARSRGACVLVGRCWEAGGAPAFWPWVQSLRSYVEQSEPDALRAQLAAGAADVAQIMPELRELFPDLPEPSMEAEGARFRLFDATVRFLKSAAAVRPLVLVLDDLHAADEPSLLLLRFIAGEVGGSRMLIVGTYRNVDPTVRDPLASTLAELAREQVTRRIALGGLTEADVARFVELDAGAIPVPGLIATLHAETEGNPLFLGEVVRLLAAEGRLADVDTRTLWTLGIPQGVREVIGRRLGRLSAECIRVLTLASVLGRDFGLDALSTLSELPGNELLDALDEAVAARVVTAAPEAHGRLRFAHALIRETLYDGLTTPRRVQLHRRAGEALEAFYGANPEPHLAELAYHFFEAAPGGDVAKALGYAQRAGESAVRVLAYEEAARLFELALQALDLTQPVDPKTRCVLLLSLGDTLARGGNTPEAKAAFLAAADVARSAALPEHLARAALGCGGRFVWLRAGSDEQLVPLLEEALQAVGETESTLRVRLLARLAGALRDQPSLEPRASLSRQAVEIARRLGDQDTLAYALSGLFTATWGPDIEELAEIAEEVTRLAEETGDPEAALQACWLRHIAWLTLSETERVAPIADEYRALAQELKQPSHQWYVAVMRSVWALFRGEFEEAERLVDDAQRIGSRAQTWDAGCSYRLALFALRREQGRLDEIEGIIKASVVEYPGYRVFRCLVVLLECELGREAVAQHDLEELAAEDFAALPRDGEWLFCLCTLAEVAARLHDRDRAAILYEQLAPYAHLNPLASGEIAAGSVARYLGMLASTTGRWNDAARLFDDALEMNERMGARPWLAHTQEDYASMLIARNAPGDNERSRKLLELAFATYDELGMHKHTASSWALP